MAELEKLEVVFSAQFTQLLGAFDAIAKAAVATGQTAAKANEPAIAAQNQLQNALGLTGKAFNVVAGLAAAAGAAFVGMRLGEFIAQSTTLAARYETMGVVLNQLARNTNYSAVQVQGFAQGVQSMGITMTGSREIVGRMIQGNIDLASATKLARLSQDAAVIANINSSDAMERLVYGIQSAQVEVLRTLGLNVTFESSYTAMAAALNKSSAELTEQEKTQARVNAVMQAGVTISGAYAAAMDTAGKQVLSMSRYVENIQTNLGGVFMPAYTSLVFQIANGLKSIDTALASSEGQAAIAQWGAVFKAVADNLAPVIVGLAAAIGVTLAGALVSFVAASSAAQAAFAALAGAFGGLPAILGIMVGSLVGLMMAFSSGKSDVQTITELTKKYAEANRDTTRTTDEQTRALREQAEAAAKAAIANREATLASTQRSADNNAARLLTEYGNPRRSPYPDLGILNQRRPPLAILQGEASNDPAIAFRQLQQALQEFAASSASVEERAAALAKRIEELRAATGGTGGNIDKLTTDLRGLLSAVVSAPALLSTMNGELGRLKQSLSEVGNSFNMGNFNTSLTNTLKTMNMTGGVAGAPVLTEQQTQAKALQDAFLAVSSAIQQAQNQIAALSRDLMKMPMPVDQTTQEAEVWKAKMEQIASLTRTIYSLFAAMPGMLRSVAAGSETMIDRELRASREALATAGITNPVARSRIEQQQQIERYMRDPLFGAGKSETERRSRAVEITNNNLAASAKEYAASMGTGAQQAEIGARFAQRLAEAQAEGGYAVRQVQAEMDQLLAASGKGTSAAEASARAREAEAKAIGEAVAQARILTRESQQQADLAMAKMRGPASYNVMALEFERARLMREVGPNAPGVVDAGVEAMRAQQMAQTIVSMAQIGEQANQNKMTAEAEMQVLGQSNAIRQQAVSLAQLQYQYEQALVGATDAQKTKLTEAYNQAVGYVNVLAQTQVNLQNMQQVNEAMRGVGTAIGTAFTQAIVNGEKLDKVLQNLLSTILQIMMKQMLFKPLEDMFGSMFSGGGGGLSSIFGNFFGGSSGGGMWDSVPGVSGWWAEGGVPGGNGLAPYRNQIVTSPTIFPFARGGNYGMMGEAGPEAIFPVIRMPSGDLGVRAQGGGAAAGGGPSKFEVNVYAPPGSNVKEERNSEGDLERLNLYIDAAVAKNMVPGTKTFGSIQRSFGARQQVVKR